MTSTARESAVRTPVGVAIIIPRPRQPSLELPPYIDVRTGVTLQEMLQILAPLASSLEVLNLGAVPGLKDIESNDLGGTITADVMVYTKLKVLNLSSNQLRGKICITSIRALYVLLTFSRLFAGELPKELPVSLEVLILGEDYKNANKFTGGIPSEWGALTNLKKLMMVSCGLHGEICMSQQTCIVCLLTFTCVLQERCPRSSATSSI